MSRLKFSFFNKIVSRILILFVLPVLWSAAAYAQCPLNIDFETGDFTNWKCYRGTTSAPANVNIINVSPSNPTQDIHTIIPKGSITDQYGGFPISPPNGGNYSVKLGNNGTGAQAERLSYTFTVPADQLNFSLTYQYAVVLEDPGHNSYQQPRFTAKVLDVAANSYITCSSFDYVATANLPGFKRSPNSTDVVYKGWTPVTIDLSGYQGKKITLEFTTADCTPSAHFGYAYIDVNSSCSHVITGTDFCNATGGVTLTGPNGFATYSWYNADRSKLLGSTNPINFDRALPDGTVIILDVTPYDGFGCQNTITATMHYNVPNLTITDPPEVCFPDKVDLTASAVTNGSSGISSLSYWADADATIALANYNAVADSGRYYIKASNSLGCVFIEPVYVNIHKLPVIKITPPQRFYQPHTIDLTADKIVKGSSPNLKYTYWIDANLTTAVDDPKAITKGGTYYIMGQNTYGCSSAAPVEVIIAPLPNILAPKAFTPSQTNNNRLNALLVGVKTFKYFKVYNRWGNVVFYTTNAAADMGWDGAYKGAIQFMDTFTWEAEGYDYLDKLVHRNGNTVLLK